MCEGVGMVLEDSVSGVGEDITYFPYCKPVVSQDDESRIVKEGIHRLDVHAHVQGFKVQLRAPIASHSHQA